jgi:hypothetical protein
MHIFIGIAVSSVVMPRKNMENKVSCMSNSKWRKLFKAITPKVYGIEVSCWKFIDSEQIIKNPWPNANEILDDRFEDGVKYKGIEWIKIPKRFKRPPYEKIGYQWEHDLEAIISKLNELGKFCFDFNEDGLIIYGYKIA